MAYTGYKQAVVAYKVSASNGEPLDINGIPTRLSGKKQSIALLDGRTNPDPQKYEVETYFFPKGTAVGESTVIHDTRACPVGYIRVNPDRLILTKSRPSGLVVLASSHYWKLLSSPPGITVDFAFADAGNFQITVTRTNAQAQGLAIFRNEVTLQSASVWLAALDSTNWILDTGSWDTFGSWYKSGVWKFDNSK